MYSIHIFDASMKKIGEFLCPEYGDALSTFREFVQSGYTATLHDTTGKELATQFVYH